MVSPQAEGDSLPPAASRLGGSLLANCAVRWLYQTSASLCLRSPSSSQDERVKIYGSQARTGTLQSALPTCFVTCHLLPCVTRCLRSWLVSFQAGCCLLTDWPPPPGPPSAPLTDTQLSHRAKHLANPGSSQLRPDPAGLLARSWPDSLPGQNPGCCPLPPSAAAADTLVRLRS